MRDTFTITTTTNVNWLTHFHNSVMHTQTPLSFLHTFFLVFDFCQFCVVIRFFHPATTTNDLRLRRISIPLIHYIYFLILILEKEPVFPFSMLNAKQVNYRYHFYNVFDITRTGD